MENHDVILAAINEHSEKFTKAQHALSAQQSEAAERLAGIEQEVAAMKGLSVHGGGFTTVPSVASQFLKSDQLQAMREGANGTGRVTLKHAGLSTITKAITAPGAGQSGDTGYDVPAQRDPSLFNFPQRRLSLLDVLPSLPVSSGAYEYLQLLDYVNAAAVQVKQGDTKAEQSVNTQLVTANIATIAAWVKASMQVLQDSGSLAQNLNNLLAYGARAKLEAQLIAGPGGAGQIKGLSAWATAYAADATAPADRIGESLDELDTNGWTGSLIVMAPKAWGKIQRARTPVSGEYELGSPRDPSPPSLWGVPVVTSPALGLGTALVLDRSQVAVLDRQEVVVASSREDGANFVTNMVTILAELRASLAVMAPGAVLSVDLNPTT